MALSDNPRERIGGNFGPPLDEEDEKAPPKSERIVTDDDVEVFKVVCKTLATRSSLARWKIIEKRKGGIDGRTMRCVAIGYMRGLGFPVWKLEMMWDINRKQIGNEEEAYIIMQAESGFIGAQISRFEDLLDAALAIEIEEFLTEAGARLQQIVDDRRNAKAARAVAKEAAKKNPAPPPPPKIKTRAESIQEAANAKHRLKTLEAEVEIHLSVIAAAAKPGAGKVAKSDAKKAADAIEKAHPEIKRLRKVVKAATL